jgi:hyaluronoglucosaminidase
MKKVRTLAAAAAMVFATQAVVAQNDFDFSTQRGERQEVNPVGGHRVDRAPGTPVINPVPRQADISSSLTVSCLGGFKLNVPKELAYAVPALPVTPDPSAKKLPLTVKYGAKAADKAGVPDKADAYKLTVDTKGITITGRDRRGALYALYTLDQLMGADAAHPASIPQCSITDWPEFPQRGLVEGFYGTPWSHETRLALIDQLGRNKMNTYIYGPKDDPYHSSPNWRKPYPADQAAKIRELAERAQKAGVDFVWAIHPGKDIRWNKEDYDSLLHKFELMYDLGVRGFSVFFDDIEGEGTNPRKQTELLNDLNRDFVAKKPDVAPLSVCPTEYSRLWANPKPGGANDIYGQTLDKGINVFYTGDVVCSDLTHETLQFMDPLIQRPAYFWWNFPVSDYCRNFLLLGPVYGLETDITADETVGVLSNPMEHGYASMPALYMLADYNWNPADYNAIDSWERSIVDLVGPEAAPAYRAFAINAADTRNGYRRDESWEMPRVADPFALSDADRATLRRQFTELKNAPAILRADKDAAPLVAEIEPWLAQAEALGARLLAALDLTAPGATSADLPARWATIADALPTAAEQEAFDAHTLGTLRLLPFHRTVTEKAARDLYSAVAGREPALVRFAGTYPNLLTAEAYSMIDGDTATYYHSGHAQRPGDRIAIDLGVMTPVSEVYLLQGRNEGDVDYYDAFIIEVSADGTNWTALTSEPVIGTYEYTWKGEPVDARYLRLRRDDSSKRTNWTAVRELSINPATAEERGLASTDMFTLLSPEWLRAIDNNPTTGVMLDGTVRYTIPEAISSLTILSDKNGAALEAVWFDAEGHNVGSKDIYGDKYATLEVPAGATSLLLSGKGMIQEIIAR